MWFSELLQKGGVEITPKIKTRIDKFGDRWIPEQFREDFLKRIENLLDSFVVGIKPPISLRKGPYISLLEIFSYTSKDFAEKYPKFEVLFLNIWCLIRASRYYCRKSWTYNELNTMMNDDGNIIGYYYCRQAADDTVTIKFKGDSATVEIERNWDTDPFIIFKINEN
jgi:hypothetical protein